MEELARYNMGWNQAKGAWMVVYAKNLDEAEMLFNKGDYQLELDE